MRLGQRAGAIALEKAVRPFMFDPPRARQTRADPPRDESEAVLTWTAKTRVEVVSVSSSFRVIPSSEPLNELTRTVNTVRVTNPSDSAQFVDVENTKTIDFRRGKAGSKQRYTFK